MRFLTAIVVLFLATCLFWFGVFCAHFFDDWFLRVFNLSFSEQVYVTIHSTVKIITVALSFTISIVLSIVVIIIGYAVIQEFYYQLVVRNILRIWMYGLVPDGDEETNPYLRKERQEKENINQSKMNREIEAGIDQGFRYPGQSRTPPGFPNVYRDNGVNQANGDDRQADEKAVEKRSRSEDRGTEGKENRSERKEEEKTPQSEIRGGEQVNNESSD